MLTPCFDCTSGVPTARLWEDETRNGHRNIKRNPWLMMAKVEFFFQMSHLIRNLWWPWRISLCIWWPFWVSSSWKRAVLTSLSRLDLPIFLQLLTAVGCRTTKAWGLSQGCRVRPRRRLLVPDDSSWILALRVSFSSAFFSFFFAGSHNLLP